MFDFKTINLNALLKCFPLAVKKPTSAYRFIDFPIQNLRNRFCRSYLKLVRAKTQKSYLHGIPPFHSPILNHSSFLHSPFARLRLHYGRKCAREVRVETASSFPTDLRDNLCGLRPWMDFQLVFWDDFVDFKRINNLFLTFLLLTRSTISLFCLCVTKNEHLKGVTCCPGAYCRGLVSTRFKLFVQTEWLFVEEVGLSNSQIKVMFHLFVKFSNLMPKNDI